MEQSRVASTSEPQRATELEQITNELAQLHAELAVIDTTILSLKEEIAQIEQLELSLSNEQLSVEPGSDTASVEPESSDDTNRKDDLAYVYEVNYVIDRVRQLHDMKPSMPRRLLINIANAELDGRLGEIDPSWGVTWSQLLAYVEGRMTADQLDAIYEDYKNENQQAEPVETSPTQTEIPKYRMKFPRILGKFATIYTALYVIPAGASALLGGEDFPKKYHELGREDKKTVSQGLANGSSETGSAESKDCRKFVFDFNQTGYQSVMRGESTGANNKDVNSEIKNGGIQAEEFYVSSYSKLEEVVASNALAKCVKLTKNQSQWVATKLRSKFGAYKIVDLEKTQPPKPETVIVDSDVVVNGAGRAIWYSPKVQMTFNNLISKL